MYSFSRTINVKRLKGDIYHYYTTLAPYQHVPVLTHFLSTYLFFRMAGSNVDWRGALNFTGYDSFLQAQINQSDCCNGRFNCRSGLLVYVLCHTVSSAFFQVRRQKLNYKINLLIRLLTSQHELHVRFVKSELLIKQY